MVNWDYQKVLDRINHSMWNQDMETTEYVSTLQAALEKQIPKKVISNSKVYFCPCCKGSVWQNADESNYCFRCGQKLEW